MIPARESQTTAFKLKFNFTDLKTSFENSACQAWLQSLNQVSILGKLLCNRSSYCQNNYSLSHCLTAQCYDSCRNHTHISHGMPKKVNSTLAYTYIALYMFLQGGGASTQECWTCQQGASACPLFPQFVRHEFHSEEECWYWTIRWGIICVKLPPRAVAIVSFQTSTTLLTSRSIKTKTIHEICT